VVPLKSSLAKDKLESALVAVSALIIPEARNEPYPSFFELLSQALPSHKDLPVMAFGNSALMLMSFVSQREELRAGMRVESKGKDSAEASVFATHCDAYFSNLSLKSRLELENKPKTALTSGRLPIAALDALLLGAGLDVLAIGRARAEEWQLLLARQ
jgi:hypothetical protein